jgi:hypothetical protein
MLYGLAGEHSDRHVVMRSDPAAGVTLRPRLPRNPPPQGQPERDDVVVLVALNSNVVDLVEVACRSSACVDAMTASKRTLNALTIHYDDRIQAAS